MAIENNPNRSNQQKKKKKGSGLWGLILLAVIWAFNRLNSEDVARFFSRLRWMFRTGNFRLDDSFIAVIAAIVLVIVLSVTIVRIKKVRAARRFDGIKARRHGRGPLARSAAGLPRQREPGRALEKAARRLPGRRHYRPQRVPRAARAAETLIGFRFWRLVFRPVSEK